MGNCSCEQRVQTEIQNEQISSMITNLTSTFPDVKKQSKPPGGKFQVFSLDRDVFQNIIEPIQQLDNFNYESDKPQQLEGPFYIEKEGHKSIYFGSIKNQLQNGPGLLIFQNGTSYQGNWENGEPNGYGRYIHEDGTVYEGQWKNSQAHGYGKFYLQDGISEGMWENNEKNGHGRETWNEGQSYEGYYKNGIKEGNGIYRWNFNEYYEGEFKNDEIEGYGIHQWSDGSMYKGEWKNFEMNGKGEFIWPNKMKFVGTYKNGKRNGEGKFSWPDGKYCTGIWENGIQKEVQFFGGEGEIIPDENKDRLSIDYSQKQSFKKQLNQFKNCYKIIYSNLNKDDFQSLIGLMIATHLYSQFSQFFYLIKLFLSIFSFSSISILVSNNFQNLFLQLQQKIGLQKYNKNFLSFIYAYVNKLLKNFIITNQLFNIILEIQIYNVKKIKCYSQYFS